MRDKRAYDRERYHRIKDRHPRVAPERREYVSLLLAEGMTIREAAKRAGMAYDTVSFIRRTLRASEVENSLRWPECPLYEQCLDIADADNLETWDCRTCPLYRPEPKRMTVEYASRRKGWP